MKSVVAIIKVVVGGGVMVVIAAVIAADSDSGRYNQNMTQSISLT